uniref:WH2 domain-containing protein n=1 Tax=Rhabditophanes sp. KR3021 TaxID=114890 RepID=A0AC35TME2_9BILA
MKSDLDVHHQSCDIWEHMLTLETNQKNISFGCTKYMAHFFQSPLVISFLKPSYESLSEYISVVFTAVRFSCHEYHSIFKQCPGNEEFCIHFSLFCDQVSNCPLGGDEITSFLTEPFQESRRSSSYDLWSGSSLRTDTFTRKRRIVTPHHSSQLPSYQVAKPCHKPRSVKSIKKLGFFYRNPGRTNSADSSTYNLSTRSSIKSLKSLSESFLQTDKMSAEFGKTAPTPIITPKSKTTDDVAPPTIKKKKSSRFLSNLFSKKFSSTKNVNNINNVSSNSDNFKEESQNSSTDSENDKKSFSYQKEFTNLRNTVRGFTSGFSSKKKYRAPNPPIQTIHTSGSVENLSTSMPDVNAFTPKLTKSELLTPPTLLPKPDISVFTSTPNLYQTSYVNCDFSDEEEDMVEEQNLDYIVLNKFNSSYNANIQESKKHIMPILNYSQNSPAISINGRGSTSIRIDSIHVDTYTSSTNIDTYSSTNSASRNISNSSTSDSMDTYQEYSESSAATYNVKNSTKPRMIKDKKTFIHKEDSYDEDLNKKTLTNQTALKKEGQKIAQLCVTNDNKERTHVIAVNQASNKMSHSPPLNISAPPPPKVIQTKFASPKTEERYQFKIPEPMPHRMLETIKHTLPEPNPVKKTFKTSPKPEQKQKSFFELDDKESAIQNVRSTLRKISPPVEKIGMNVGRVVEGKGSSSSKHSESGISSDSSQPTSPIPPPPFLANNNISRTFKVDNNNVTSFNTIPKSFNLPPPLPPTMNEANKRVPLKQFKPPQKNASSEDNRNDLLSEIRKFGGAATLKKNAVSN